MTESLIGQLGYLGFFVVLVLGGLGLPVPEEAPIILAAILSRKGAMFGPIAFASCMAGVIVGDFIVYFLGYFYGEKVLNLKLTQKFLTKEREAQIKGYFHRHGIKILILGRFAVGFRTAAYLTAGILKLPPLKLLLIDLCAATFSTVLMFGLGWFFAHQIEHGMREAQHWVILTVAIVVGLWFLHRFYKGRQNAGRLVGPPVLVTDDDSSLTLDDVPALKPAPAAPLPPSVPQVEVTAPQPRDLVEVEEPVRR